MNLLALLQDTCREAGISGYQGITDVTTVTGQQARALEWVQKAWMEIQRKHNNWRFMRFTATFATVQGQWQYNGGGNESTATASPLVTANSPALVNGVAPAMHRLKRDTWRIYDNVAGQATEVRLSATHDWDTFRELFRFSSVQFQQSRPTYIAMLPNNDVALAMVPDNGAGSGYTAYGDFYIRPARFAAPPSSTLNAATPWMPEEYHELIVWLAVYRYAGFQEATSQYVHAKNMADPIWNAIQNDQLEDADDFSPLA